MLDIISQKALPCQSSILAVKPVTVSAKTSRYTMSIQVTRILFSLFKDMLLPGRFDFPPGELRKVAILRTCASPMRLGNTPLCGAPVPPPLRIRLSIPPSPLHSIGVWPPRLRLLPEGQSTGVATPGGGVARLAGEGWDGRQEPPPWEGFRAEGLRFLAPPSPRCVLRRPA